MLRKCILISYVCEKINNLITLNIDINVDDIFKKYRIPTKVLHNALYDMTNKCRIDKLLYTSNSDLSNSNRIYVREWVCSFIEDIEFVKDVVIFKMAGNYLGNICLKFIATLPFIFCVDNTN